MSKSFFSLTTTILSGPEAQLLSETIRRVSADRASPPPGLLSSPSRSPSPPRHQLPLTQQVVDGSSRTSEGVINALELPGRAEIVPSSKRESPAAPMGARLDQDDDPTMNLDPNASLNEIKCALLDVVYGTARGVTASVDQRAQVRGEPIRGSAGPGEGGAHQGRSGPR